jgi:cell division transport system ATP-binding protein
MDVSADSSAPLIAFDRVTKRYAGKVALEQLSFTIARNEFVWLTGPEGAGKSTVLRLIAALERPTAGTIRIAGVPLAAVARRALPLLRRSLGFVPQEPVLLPDRSVIENVELPLTAAGVRRNEARERAASALRHVGIEDEAGSLPSRLSVGVRRRIAWARALVNRPALLLADEPMVGLDDASASAILKLLEVVPSSGVTVLLATRATGAVPPASTRTIALARPSSG